MACPSLNFSQVVSMVGLNGASIVLSWEGSENIPPCTNIQLRFRLQDGTIEDWTDYSSFTTSPTTINFTMPEDACFIDTRLSQCCGGDGGGFPDLPDDPPCSLIEATSSDCSSSKITIINPYRRPADNTITQEYNSIFVPKEIKLTVDHTDCDTIEGLLCSIRCPDIATGQGKCPFAFNPYVDVFTLPQINLNRTPYGVPIDFDKLCNSSNYKGKPQFTDPKYTKVEAYTKNLFGATPFIDGIGYKISSINKNTYVKIHTTNSASDMRNWLINHFRFFTLNTDQSQVKFVWPYTDLYWTPYDLVIPNSLFTPEEGTIYLELVPC